MAWSSTLLSALASPAGAPRLILGRYGWSGSPGTNTDIARSAWDSSGVIGISSSAGLAMTGQAVSVPAFTSNRGGFRVGLASEAAVSWAHTDLVRGALAYLAIQYPGMVGAEEIAVGRINDLTGVGPVTVMSAWDLVAAAMTRTAWIGADQTALFYHCTAGSGHTATLTSAYTPGDSTLTFGAAPQHEKETGGTGAVLVTPTGGGTPFILTWTGTSGSTLTGVSAAGVYGTTAVSAAIGSTVQEVAWIDENPIIAAAKIITSTGLGTNGIYDTLPASWGFGLPSALVDYAGIQAAANDIAPSTGNHDIYLVSTEEQNRGLEWLQAILSTYGAWLTMSQGQLTARAAIDRWAAVPTTVLTLGRSNLLQGLPVVQRWDSGSPVEYAGIETIYSGSTLTDTGPTPATRPIVQRFTTDYGEAIYQNGGAIAAKLNERIGSWRMRIPSRVTVFARLEAAQMCPGDWVLLAHPGVVTPSNPSGGAVYAMVAGVSTDWLKGSVTLTLLVQHSAENA